MTNVKLQGKDTAVKMDTQGRLTATPTLNAFTCGSRPSQQPICHHSSELVPQEKKRHPSGSSSPKSAMDPELSDTIQSKWETTHAHNYSLYTLRRVPFPFRKQVQEVLNRMESMWVISNPTPWCAGMVVVRKKSGAVRLCGDLRPLKENVLHP